MKITVRQLLTIIIVIAIVGIGAYFATTKLKNNTSSSKVRQAVFLTNGQVYFGYATNENGPTVTLTNIYYLQVNQNLQQSSSSSTANQNQQLSLVKLGNELHGPTDEMRINHEQILFIEDMKSDSKVNQAIASYVKSNGASTSQ